MKKKNTEEKVNNDNISEVTNSYGQKDETTEEIPQTPKKRGRKKKVVEETKVVEEIKEVVENEEAKSTEIEDVNDESVDVDDELQINEDEIQEIINDEETDDSFIIQEDTVQKDLKEIADNKDEEPQGRRIKIPLVALILVVLLIVGIIITLVVCKDRIFKVDKDKNAYSNELPVDNELNEEEKIGYNLITEWLDGYKDTGLEITDRIFAYNIKSVSLNSKVENKFIILASFDVTPASIDSSIWLAGNGEKDEETIKNKTQYFVIELIQGDYKIINTSTDKPDINDESLTEEKAMILIKSDFPDVGNLNLLADSNMIDELTDEQKNNVLSVIGGTFDDYYKITGSYRKTFILGTFLVNKQNSAKWFVDDNGVATKLIKSTQILNIANFEIQGDLSITKEQAILVTFNGFPKNNRKNLSIVENWIDNMTNQENIKEKLGEISEYYGLKTNDMEGIIAVSKSGISKYFVSKDGEVTDLVGVEDITTIIK